MTRKWKSVVASLLVVTTMHMSMIASTQAVIVETDAVQSVAEKQIASNAGRARLNSLIERPEVADQIVKLGFSREEAFARVNAMTDDEIIVATNKLDKLPAGADGLGTFLGVLLFVFIVLLITDILGLTKIFPFTRSVR